MVFKMGDIGKFLTLHLSQIRAEFDGKVTRCSQGQGNRKLVLENKVEQCSVSKVRSFIGFTLFFSFILMKR